MCLFWNFIGVVFITARLDVPQGMCLSLPLGWVFSGSLCSGRWELIGLPGLQGTWELYIYRPLEIFCPSFWTFVLHICILIFSKRIKEFSMWIPGALPSSTFSLSGICCMESNHPSSLELWSLSLGKTATLCLAFPFLFLVCAFRQKVGESCKASLICLWFSQGLQSCAVHISVFVNNIYFVQFSLVYYSGRVSLVLLILALDISFKDFFNLEICCCTCFLAT